MAKIKVTGLEDIEKKLKANATLADVKKVVRHNGAELQKKIQRKADFKKGYQTGTTKRSVKLEITDGGLTAESGPETEYAPYVEYGTRFMEAQPFVRPAFDEQKKVFQNDLKKLMR
jgi:HK97 gp10 family phage protein